MKTGTRIIALAAVAALMLLGSMAVQAQPSRSDAPKTRSIEVEPKPRPDHDRDWDRDRDRDRELSVSVWTGRTEYEIGDSARIYFKTNRDAYVFVYSTNARGVTTQIFPNYYDRDNRVDGGRTYKLPGANYRLRVTPPTGRETITVYAYSARGRSVRNPRRLSSSSPFPRTSSPSAELRSIMPEGRRHRDYDVDTASIRVVYDRR